MMERDQETSCVISILRLRRTVLSISILEAELDVDHEYVSNLKFWMHIAIGAPKLHACLIRQSISSCLGI